MIRQDDAEFHCEYTNRKDRVFSLQDLEHSCIPPAGDIRNYGGITSKEDSETDLNDFTKQQILFAGKYNLSLSSVNSKEFYTLINSAIKLGQQNPESNPSSLFPQISRNTFTVKFIEFGKEVYNDILQKFRVYECNALAIDAGKEGSKNYLDILLTNALVLVKPLLYEGIELFDGSFNSYYKEISDVIVKLSSQNITVSGIVCDNLRVQSSAIEKVILDYGKTFVKVPCSCHTIQLALNDLFKDPIMSDSLSCIETFSHIFNSKQGYKLKILSKEMFNTMVKFV